MAKLSDRMTYPEACKIFFQEEDSIFLMNYDKDVDEIHMYHSPEALGGSLLNPASFMVALNGFGTASLPIIIGDTKVKGGILQCPHLGYIYDSGRKRSSFQGSTSISSSRLQIQQLLTCNLSAHVSIRQGPNKRPCKYRYPIYQCVPQVR